MTSTQSPDCGGDKSVEPDIVARLIGTADPSRGLNHQAVLVLPDILVEIHGNGALVRQISYARDSVGRHGGTDRSSGRCRSCR